MKGEPKTIVVLYYTRGVYPLRDTIQTHLYCWKKYSRHSVCYINVAFGYPAEELSRLQPDVIIFHTIYLSMRWAPEVFEQYTSICEAVAEIDCMKIALPQDEFIHTDLLGEYLGKVGVTHIGTCLYEQDWKTIYRRLWDTHPDPDSVKFRTVLTGYLDDASVKRIERMKVDSAGRSIDVGYRAWKAQYWLGEHGMHKVWVADRVGEAARGAKLNCDISMEDADALSGDEWFKFLLNCRTTVGVEGGASLCDHDGAIRESVEEYVGEYPKATFEETRDACFPGRDNSLSLACISPRHLEACVTKTTQVLVEGRYSDILKPGEDYISVAADYSNLDEVIEQIKDVDYCRRIAERSYENVVVAGSNTYRQFVKGIEEDWIEPYCSADSSNTSKKANKIVRKLNLRDALIWRFIRFEIKEYQVQSVKIRQYLSRLHVHFEKYLKVDAAESETNRCNT